MSETFRNYIDGEWREAVKGATFESTNPAHRERGDRRRSSARPPRTWPRRSRPRRAPSAPGARCRRPSAARSSTRVARCWRSARRNWPQLMTREMGKVLKEARGDVQEGIDMAKYIAGEGRRIFGQTVPSELRNKFCMTVRQPLGVVGLITPWNFPMAIPCWKMLPALLCGNTVVFKPAEDTPACATRLVEIFDEAGMPPGVLNLVTGYGEEAGEPLLRAPTRGRDLVHRLDRGGPPHRRCTCGRNLKRVSLEMGGKNAIIVMDDADLDLVLDGALWGGFGTAGPALHRQQPPDRPARRRAARCSERLVARAEALAWATGCEPEVEVGPVVNARSAGARPRLHRDRHRPRAPRLLTGGRVLTEDGLARATSMRRRCSATSTRTCASRRKRSSAPPCRSSPSTPSSRPSTSPTARATASRWPSTRATSTAPSAPSATGGGHRLRQCPDDRRGDPAALRRHQGHRQRPPRGRHHGDRAVQRDQERLRRLQRHAAARADRQSHSQ